jgi:F-type H+-transporting ATPase subunit gamma
MPSLREIRRKIKSVKSTQQITRAMKMVAAARMRRAQSAIVASRPFAVKMEEAVRNLAALEVSADLQAGREAAIHPFFDGRLEGQPCLVIVSGDKGLCGAFNTNAIRAAIDWLRQRRGQRVFVAAVGRKGRDFIRRVRDVDVDIVSEMVGIFPKAHYAHAEILGKALIDAYLEGGCSTVDVIYNEFKSVASQRVVKARILPIPASGLEGNASKTDRQDFKFEPGREELLAALLPRYINYIGFCSNPRPQSLQHV